MERRMYEEKITMNEEDRIVMKAVRSICSKGNDVEIRRNKDGSLKVYEIKKNIAVG